MIRFELVIVVFKVIVLTLIAVGLGIPLGFQDGDNEENRRREQNQHFTHIPQERTAGKSAERNVCKVDNKDYS